MEIIAKDKAGNVASSAINVATANFGPSLINAQLIGILIGLAIGVGITAGVLVAKYRGRNSKSIASVDQP
jgi:sorbitol-specific phosphotransferase system component IIBC